MNMLKRVILINSGGYSELEVPCDGHVQVVGMNGHGKTTLLRAILFFYVGNNDNASYGIHTTQRDFTSHYLGGSPSYLIYEVERSGGASPFHIAVARPSSRVQFLFVDDAYDEALYIDPSRVVRSFETVLSELDSRLVQHETLSSYDSFRETIYGVRKSPFSVFRANPRASQQVEILPRIISGIFTVNRMDANRLKRALCCGLLESPESLRIDLRQLRNNLSDFQRINRAVKTYLSNQRTAETILEWADKYEDNSEQLEREVRDFVARAKAIPEKESELQHLLAEAEENVAKLKSENQEKQDDHRKKLDGLKEELAELKVKIAGGEKLQQVYQEKCIDEKVAALESLPALRQKHAEAEARYLALTKQYDSESKRRDELLDGLKRAKESAVADLQIQKSECQEQRHKELDDLHHKFQRRRQEIHENEQKRSAALSPRRMKLNAEEANLTGAWKQFHEKREPETLRRKRMEQEQLEANLAKWEKQRDTILTDAKMAQLRHESSVKGLEREREKLDESLAQEKKILDDERERLRMALDSMEKSIAGLIRQSKPQWLPDAARTLSEKFLFHDADSLEAVIRPNADSPLLGLKLNPKRLEDLEPVEIDPAVLQTQLAENRSARDAYAERAERQRSEIDVKRHNLDGERVRQVESWEVEKSNLDKSIRNGQNARVDVSNTITNLVNQWEGERTEGKERLQIREEELKKLRRELEDAVNQIRRETNERGQQAQEDEDKERSIINERTNERLNEIAERIKRQEKHYKDQAISIETEFLKELENKGANPDILKRTSEEVQIALGSVKEVEGYKSVVERYLDYKRDHIEPLPSWKSRRQVLNEAVDGAEMEWNEQVQSFRQLEREGNERISKYNGSLDAISRDKTEMENFRKDLIYVDYLGLFSDDSFEPSGDYQPDSLRGLEQSARRTHTWREKIDIEGDKFTRGFLNKFEFPGGEENDLGFAPIPDGFKWTIFAGDRLRSFVRLKKIERFRTLQAKQFDTIISQIVREVSRLEDALRQVKATARKVQNDLAEDKFIDVLDSIELRVQDEPSELWNQLKRMERFQNLNFGSEFDLFQAQADDSSVKEAIQAFEKLVTQLDRERKDALELEDSFEFTIRVIENGHDHGFRASLDHIGSTGTDYLVKMLIYLSLIDLIRRQALADDDQACLHCILDETGVLAPKYVKEAIRYAEKKRIFLITAGHSATSKGFRYWFRVQKRGQYFGGEQIISKHPVCE
jgi:hypothetical protein